MKTFLWIIGLAACAFVIFAIVNERTPESQAQNAVRGVLKDPDSAKFISVTRREGTPFVCGVVNAKNSFGGYTGGAPFAYDSTLRMAAVISGPRDAFIWKDLARGCFPNMKIPTNAGEVAIFERMGNWSPQ